jgi:RNA polymerase sigma factor (sigma-70 family)
VTSGQIWHFLHQLRGLLGPASAARESDGELLARFARSRDEEAFARLMERHGAMVLAVCRRVLRQPQDAEDAFQATFLVLARQADAIRKQESVGSWLYGTSYRMSLKVRESADRRRSHESGGDQSPPLTEYPAVPLSETSDLERQELRAVLDEELQRLPEKYRAPLVLCYLEGKTNEQAAEELAWTKGTVSGRLARARDLLRDRLRRRGVALTAVAVGGVLSEQMSVAAVPARLSSATIRAASLFGAGEAAGTLPAHVTLLAEGALQAMTMSKWKIVAAVVLALSVLGFGGALGYRWQNSGAAEATSTTPSAGDSEVAQPSRPVRASDPTGMEIKYRYLVVTIEAPPGWEAKHSFSIEWEGKKVQLPIAFRVPGLAENFKLGAGPEIMKYLKIGDKEIPVTSTESVAYRVGNELGFAMIAEKSSKKDALAFSLAGWATVSPVDYPGPSNPNAAKEDIERVGGMLGRRLKDLIAAGKVIDVAIALPKEVEDRGKTDPPGVPLELKLVVRKTTHTLDLKGKTGEEFRRDIEGLKGHISAPPPLGIYTAPFERHRQQLKDADARGERDPLSQFGTPFRSENERALIPKTPAVEFELHLRNTGDKEITFVKESIPYRLSLEGPGACKFRTIDWQKWLGAKNRLVRLMPGETYLYFGLDSLRDGWFDDIANDEVRLATVMNDYLYWTEPGKYKLTASLDLFLSPAPESSQRVDRERLLLKPEDAAKLPGKVGKVTVRSNAVILDVVEEREKPSSDPPGVPLALRIVPKKDTYTFDLAGEVSKAPAVDLVLEFSNTGTKDIVFRVGGGGPDMPYFLNLEGTGAVNVPLKAFIVKTPPLPWQEITLAPGQSRDFPIQSLETPHAWRPGTRSYWTKPGEYRLTATYWTQMAPAPEKAPKQKVPGAWGDGQRPPNAGFGWVMLTSPPVKLNVVAREEKEQGKTDPPGVPLELKVVAKKDTYTLDSEQYRKRVESGQWVPPPAVDLSLQFTNTGKEEISFLVGGFAPDMPHAFKLAGPGAVNVTVPSGDVMLHGQEPTTVTLKPGASHAFPIKRLDSPAINRVGNACYWTKPGDYTLTVSYWTRVSPALKAAPRTKLPVPLPGQADFSPVLLTSEPVNLKVVDAKADAKVDNATTDPPGVPLALKVVAKKDTYTLNNVAPLRAPDVDLVLQFTNTGKEKVSFLVGGDAPDVPYFLKLEGPGAVNTDLGAYFVARRSAPGTQINLDPGKSYDFPIRRLQTPNANRRGSACYWTKAGEYTLTVVYCTAVSPAPKEAPKRKEFAPGGGFGPVVLTSAPVKLKVK